MTDGEAPRPYTLVAELSYRCPLKCAYCSNPVDFARHADGLGTDDWLTVFRDAEGLGVVQLNLTGGEPLVRDDLERLVEGARALDLYVNLITSGVPLVRERLVRLKDAGLSSVQVSVQAASAASSDRMAGLASFEHKLDVMGWVKELGLPLTMNTVLHRQNLDEVADTIALAERVRADRLELANTQYLGWALLNRDALLPTREQLARARSVAKEARQRLLGKMEVLFVLPDYYADAPRACMDGWAQRYIVVSPDGLVLPCHLAHTIPGLVFENVRERGLSAIWTSSPGLDAFRGESWMPSPCRTCDKRAVDHGGCRCQAFHLTGDATKTDPACSLAPDHALVVAARDAAVSAPGLVQLTMREKSRSLLASK